VRRHADQRRPLGPSVERGSGERLTAPTAAEAADFLRHHPPFDALDDADVLRVAAAAEVEVYPAGATVFSQGAEPVGHLRIVRSGAVELELDGRVLDLLGVGELFGHASMLSGLPTGFTARAEQDTVCYRIPAEVARGPLGRPEALQFVTRSLLDRGRLARRADDRSADGAAPSRQPVASLMRRALIVCPPQTSIRDAAQRMAESGATSVVVDLGGSLGIVTDRDLRTRVVAGGLSLDAPVSEAMTAPAYTVAADRLGSEVWLDMLDRGVRHFPVVSATGQVLGVVEDADLVAAETRTSFYLRAAIARASTTGELAAAARDLRPTIVALHRARTAPLHLAGIHSVVVDALVRRLIELTVAEIGAAPMPLAWLALGSLARREALPGSDVDSAAAWRGADEDPAILEYGLRVGRSVDEGLARCGLRVDPKGTTAANPLLVRSQASWRRAARSWLEDPTQEQALILVSVVVDSRPVWGIHTGVSLAEGFHDAQQHPALLRQLARFSLSFRPPTGFLRGLVVEHSGEHRGLLDLKHGGIVPIVDLARWAGMAAGVTSASTPERLRAAAAAGTLSPADARTLEDAFELVMSLRVQHHVEQIEAGSDPDDHIDPASLGRLTRSYLKEAFRAVGSVQKGIASQLSVGAR
jgi:CBS domain-containing protein